MKFWLISTSVMKVNSLIAAIFFLLFCSCDKALAPSEYVKWVKEPTHGLLKTKEVGGLRMEAMYKPTAYQIANEEKSNSIKKAKFNQRTSVLGKQQQYELKFTVTEREGVNLVNWRVENMQASQNRMEYLSFGMKDHIYLIDGVDTLPCLSFHFERSYDVAPYRTFLVGFDETNSKKDKTLIFDSPVFGTGPMKITFEHQAISNLPNIKLIP